MNNKKERNIEDLFALFQETLKPSDVLSAKLISQISTAITKERLKRNLSQTDFSKLFQHASQALISRWEHGECNFSLSKIAEIAVALDLDVNIYFSNTKSNGTLDQMEVCMSPFTRTIQFDSPLIETSKESQYTPPNTNICTTISTSKEEISYASIC